MSGDMMDGKTVVVTAGGSGLGLAIGQRFGQGGAFVVIADIDAQAGRRGVDVLSAAGIAAAFEPLDVRDPRQSRALVERVVATRGGIDVWVNCAGAPQTGPAESLPRESWDDSLATILSGALYCAQAVGAHMLARGSGVIVNVASVDAYQAIEGRAAGSAAMAGLVMLTQSLGIEWAARGVRVVGVAPGALATDMDATDRAHDAPAAVYEHRTPLRRLGTAEEVAEAVFFLASDEAAFIVGETMRVDGGWTAYQLF
jgi:NAD(P)-dependent dehydrogenase (short-subunit alcohol dehydrogenase family)